MSVVLAMIKNSLFFLCLTEGAHSASVKGPLPRPFLGLPPLGLGYHPGLASLPSLSNPAGWLAVACAREERWLRSAAFTTMARVNTLSAPSTFVIGPWIWLQIYLEQCLVCRVKSSLAFVKLPPLLLRNCSHLYLKDEPPGGPRGPATGAGVCGRVWCRRAGQGYSRVLGGGDKASV